MAEVFVISFRKAVLDKFRVLIYCYLPYEYFFSVIT